MKIFKKMKILVLIIFLIFIISEMVCGKMEVIRQEKLDVTRDGVEDTLILSRGITEHGPTAVLKIFDGITGKNIFLPVGKFGNIACFPGDYRFIDEKLYIPCGRLTGKTSFIDVIVYQYNQEIKMFVEDKKVSLAIKDDQNRNWNFVYQQAQKLQGEQLVAFQTLRKIIYYSKSGQLEMLKTLIGEYLGTQDFKDPLMEIYNNFQNDYCWLTESWEHKERKEDPKTGYMIPDTSSPKYIYSIFIVFNDKITGRIIDFDKDGKIIYYSASGNRDGSQEIPSFIK